MGAVWSGIKSTVKSIKEQDPDTTFAYTTLKLVVIRDRYLGLLHYAFQILIFLYVIVFLVIIERGYLETEVPIGAVRASLRKPATLTPPSELIYCSQFNERDTSFQQPCVLWDRHQVVYPPVRPGTFFITTRVTETIFNLPENCTESAILSPECQMTPEMDEFGQEKATHYYVNDIENFTLLVAHAVYGQQTTVTESNVCMDAYLPYPDGFAGDNGEKYLHRWPRNKNPKICPDVSYDESEFENEEGEVDWEDRGFLPGDVFTVKELLTAAGATSLDEPSHIGDEGYTLRHDGMVIIVFIDYSNRVSNPSELKYRYVLRRIPRIDIKSEETVYSKHPNTYVVRNRHGIMLIFLQTGEIGQFSFQAMLLSIVGGVVLLSLAATIVDLIALKFMKHRQNYYDHKYEVTDDFSDIRDAADKMEENGEKK